MSSHIITIVIFIAGCSSHDAASVSKPHLVNSTTSTNSTNSTKPSKPPEPLDQLDPQTSQQQSPVDIPQQLDVPFVFFGDVSDSYVHCMDTNHEVAPSVMSASWTIIDYHLGTPIVSETDPRPHCQGLASQICQSRCTELYQMAYSTHPSLDGYCRQGCDSVLLAAHMQWLDLLRTKYGGNATDSTNTTGHDATNTTGDA